MDRPLLIFRVGYMPAYDGPGKISHGGSHVEEHGNGGEMWNFLIEDGYCYGYAMTRNFSGVDLRRLQPEKKWSDNDELSGVDIVFIARKGNDGQVVVGWYRNATVFHRSYRKRPGPNKSGPWKKLEYLCQVAAENAVLLNDAERTFRIPNGKGFPGQSNVWYAGARKPAPKPFITKLATYIGSNAKHTTRGAAVSSKKRNTWAQTLDKSTLLRIEKNAVEAAAKHFEAKRYKIKFVERDCCGWDLTATKGNEELHLEVKGHLGNVIQFELTPNEFKNMQARYQTYRVCVLRQALERGAIEIFEPKKRGGDWFLTSANGNGEISLRPQIGARASEIEGHRRSRRH